MTTPEGNEYEVEYMRDGMLVLRSGPIGIYERIDDNHAFFTLGGGIKSHAEAIKRYVNKARGE